MTHEATSYRCSGKVFTRRQMGLIREVVETCPGVSRRELAHTISELLGWTRAGGSLKGRECREFLERLETAGLLALPAKRPGRPAGSVTRVPHTVQGDPGLPLTGRVDAYAPVVLQMVQRPEDRLLFRELVGRYHYLGYTVPFGAHIQYLVSVSTSRPTGTRPVPTVVGCVQFSSPAWRMHARDQWIGWDDATRARHLQRVVSNSRFLLLPWVQIHNLASATLGLAVRHLATDWPARYGVAPLVVETLVDPARYTGGCYLAANWVVVGDTTGRGRDDHTHQHHGACPKRLLMYPLVPDAVDRLRAGG